MVTQWQERHGIPILNFFGANEGTALASDPLDIPDPAERALYFPRLGVPGSHVVQPVAGTIETKLLDPETREVINEPGVPGELAIRGATVFSGYWKRPDLTEESFDAEGYFLTGDLFADRRRERRPLPFRRPPQGPHHPRRDEHRPRGDRVPAADHPGSRRSRSSASPTGAGSARRSSRPSSCPSRVRRSSWATLSRS